MMRTPIRKLLLFAAVISALISFSFRTSYVNISGSVGSYAHSEYNEPEAVVEIFVVPEEADVGYTERLQRYITVNSTAGDVRSYAQSQDNEPEAVVQTFIVPEEADLAYTERLQRSITLNSTAGEVSPLGACSPTVQVQVIQRASEWSLLTIDENGQNKTVGGDEFYITYTDNASNVSSSFASAIALVHDRNDGSYSLDFSTTPMHPIQPKLFQVGTLTVHLQYTCGIGAMAQPSKHAWKTGGMCMATWQKKNVTKPPIREFSPPTDIDLSPYDLVISFGDSLMENMVRETGKGGKFFRNNTAFKVNIWMALNLATLPKVLLRVDQFHAKELNSSNVALILGSSVWDILVMDNIQGTEFKDHLEACRQFLESVRKKYPHVDIFWKSPSASHTHRVAVYCFQMKGCNSRVRYMSNSRALHLYHEQKKIVQEMGIPFIDLFDAYYLSADWTVWSDGRHYVSEFNRRVLNWLYSDSRDEPTKALS
jgi:hypothetical protein